MSGPPQRARLLDVAAPLAIVIAVRNGAETLARQLGALCNAATESTDFEVVIVDNGSTDGTRTIAEGFTDRLPMRVIDAPHARGAGAARNLGVAATDSRWILFCDADDEVDQHWVERMASALREGAAVVAGPIDYRRLNDPSVRAWRGADQAFLHEPLGFLPAAHSANLGLTREVFEQVGGFDEDFTTTCEDTDLCWRAQQAGYPLHAVPDALVHYRLRSTLREVWKQSLAYAAGEVRLYCKFRSSGIRRRGPAEAIHDVVWLVTRAPLAVGSGRRGAWVRRLGQMVGRARGAVHHRALWW